MLSLTVPICRMRSISTAASCLMRLGKTPTTDRHESTSETGSEILQRTLRARAVARLSREPAERQPRRLRARIQLGGTFVVSSRFVSASSSASSSRPEKQLCEVQAARGQASHRSLCAVRRRLPCGARARRACGRAGCGHRRLPGASARASRRNRSARCSSLPSGS